jgi:phosphatidylglycerol lysyltransferase
LKRWKSARGFGSLAYADAGGRRVAAGEPHVVVPPLSRLLREFELDCADAGLKPLYFGLPESALAALDPLSRRGRWHVGDLPIFRLEGWLKPEGVPAGIRAQANRARNQGVAIEHWRSRPEDRGPLDACLRAWLEDKALPPLGFVTTPWLFDPWPAQGVFVAMRQDRIVGFLTGSLALFPDLWRVDAVARDPDAPNGTSELLVVEAFRHASELCYEKATLGLAPLARRSEAPATGWVDRLSGIVRGIGLPGYSLRGLEVFKAKFRPDDWRPLYCVSGGGRLTPADVLAVARVFSGGSLFRYAARIALWRMGRRRLPVDR